ncbi:MAG: aldehyde dehydrogenase family protein [Actinobacteria bacterium]|nr:aldehyde dehydrogenase family protein [Actinomycetota bacterium]
MDTIGKMIDKALAALAKWEKEPQQKIDAVVRTVAKAVYDNAEELARLTVNETGLGNYEDNLSQDRRKSEIIWHSLKGKKSVGIINIDSQLNIVEIAKPVGVVGVVLPVTIPVTNFMANSMFALKCGNSVIHAPHPSAKKTVARTAKLVIDAISKYDIDKNLIQYLSEPTKELTQQLMSSVHVVVATGGMGMVKAAYSSGRPAYGVGPGNVQAIIDRDADIDDAARKIIASRSFNYGLPCASEQAVIVPEEMLDDIVASFIKNGAHYIDRDEDILKIKDSLFKDGILRKESLGVSAYTVARNAGIDIPKDAKIILLKGDINKHDQVLRQEKLSPVTMIYTYNSFHEAVKIAKSNLEIAGKGHSVVIHSNTKEHIEELAEAVYVARVVVNQPCNFNAGGGFTIGYAPTTTLGCGTWENNILSENLTYKHLMNVTRIGYPIIGKIPTSEEIWKF